MSDATKRYSVRATDRLFGQLGSSFGLRHGGLIYPYRKGSEGRKRDDELVGKVDPLLAHEIELTEREAAALARDGYDVSAVKAAPMKNNPADKAKAEG